MLSVTYPFAIPSFIYPFSISALDDRQVFCRMDVRTTSPKDLWGCGTIQRTYRGKSLVMEMFPAPKIINEYQWKILYKPWIYYSTWIQLRHCLRYSTTRLAIRGENLNKKIRIWEIKHDQAKRKFYFFYKFPPQGLARLSK